MNLPASRMMPPIFNVTDGCFRAASGAVVRVLCGYFLLGCCLSVSAAEPFREGFEQWEATWQVQTGATSPPGIQQERSEIAGRSGRGELIRIENTEEGTQAHLSLALPQARVLDELTLSLWLRSPQPGWQMALDVVTDAVNPRTGKPLRFQIKGDSYSETGGWRQLSCRTSNAIIQQRLILLRAQSPEAAEIRRLVVDRVILSGQLPPGVTTVHIDDLEFGPIVTADSMTASEADVVAPAEMAVPAVDFRLDRLLVDGRPFFPRMVRYHGESPELLKDLGFNVVWIPDVNDTRLIRKLWEAGLWVTTAPPRPRNDEGTPLEAGTAGLLPFHADVDPVLFWMLGTRIPGSDFTDVAQWAEQVESADRRRGRPLAADVAYAEQNFSRKLQMVGISRHPLQSSMSLNHYRFWLSDRRSLARPGAFCWTWLQTEPPPTHMAATRSASQSPAIEADQLRLQAYAALTAGYRGLGFWTSDSLAAEDPATQERRLMIRRLNLELKLLEPWLATMGSVDRIPCEVTDAATTGSARNVPLGLDMPSSQERAAQLRTRAADARRQQGRREELAGYVLRTDLGSLVIPLWLEGQSQFVPAHSASSNVTMLIPGTEQAAAVFEFSTTQLRSLRPERRAGGAQVTLPMLDQVTFLWVNSDLSLVDRVRQRISTVQAESARTQVELANLQLDRTGVIDQELQGLAPQQPDGPQKIGRAKLRLERAQSALSSGDYVSATSLSGEVLQLLRLLQRDHWDAAVEHLASPVSSPYTLCYQTLPDHWRLVGQLGTSRERSTRNLLPSGEFEDFDTMVAERWGNVQRAPETLQTSAALFPTGRKSKFALRLECRPQPGIKPPLVLDEPAVTVTTPGIPASAGQIMHISGWIKLSGPISGSRDGVLIYDNILGRSAGLRVLSGDQWTRFELLRLVPESRELKLSISLTGMGEVLLDDLQVIPHDPRLEQARQGDGSGEIQQASDSRFLDLIPKLPRRSPPAP